MKTREGIQQQIKNNEMQLAFYAQHQNKLAFWSVETWHQHIDFIKSVIEKRKIELENL